MISLTASVEFKVNSSSHLLASFSNYAGEHDHPVWFMSAHVYSAGIKQNGNMLNSRNQVDFYSQFQLPCFSLPLSQLKERNSPWTADGLANGNAQHGIKILIPHGSHREMNPEKQAL